LSTLTAHACTHSREQPSAANFVMKSEEGQTA